MSEARSTLFVIDDDPSVRTSLDRLLRSAGFTVETFPSADAFLTRPAFHGLGCVILDLEMSGLSGMDLQEGLVRAGSSLPVVFLTGYGDIPTSVEAMKQGAVDFLTKPVDDDTLLTAVETALERRRETLLVQGRLQALRERSARLTPREREVMTHVVAGKLNKQTAADLGISLKTAKVHRGRVMAKMEADSLADLVRMAERLGLGPGKD